MEKMFIRVKLLVVIISAMLVLSGIPSNILADENQWNDFKYTFAETNISQDLNKQVTLTLTNNESYKVSSVKMPDGEVKEASLPAINKFQYVSSKSQTLDFEITYKNIDNQVLSHVISYDVKLNREVENSFILTDKTTRVVYEHNLSSGQLIIYDDGYSVNGGASTVPFTGDYKISGTYSGTNSSGLVIYNDKSDREYNITLSSVRIDTSNFASRTSPIMFTSKGNNNNKNCTINLNIEGTNYLKASEDSPGIHVSGSKMLSPYKQTLNIRGTGTLETIGGNEGPGIGQMKQYSGQVDNEINIYSGTIIATGGENAPGIGPGVGTAGGSVNIYGGNVTANGGAFASGIGGGLFYPYQNFQDLHTDSYINITGGTVTATGGTGGAGIGTGTVIYGENNFDPNPLVFYTNINISGNATVTATGGYFASGIGNSCAYVGTDKFFLDKPYTPNEARISISGGKITAKAGLNNAGQSNAHGAGIGSTRNGVTDFIKISGGEITSTGSDQGAAIGSGFSGYVRNIDITGGNLELNQGLYSTAIGLGFSNGKDTKAFVTNINIDGINNLRLNAKSGSTCSLIGSGYKSAAGNYSENKVEKIRINNSNISAILKDDALYAAAIGSSLKTQVNLIEIMNSNIQVKGGAGGAGIGAGGTISDGYASKVGKISIVKSNINAIGGYHAPGIGSGALSSVDDVSIINSKVHSTSLYGGFAAGIGCGIDGNLGKLSIDKNSNVTAIGSMFASGIGRTITSQTPSNPFPIIIEDGATILVIADGDSYIENDDPSASHVFTGAIDQGCVNHKNSNITAKILMGDFKTPLSDTDDTLVEIKDVFIRDTKTKAAVNSFMMPKKYASFAVTTNNDASYVMVNNKTYAGSLIKRNEDNLNLQMNTKDKKLSAYWKLQLEENIPVTFKVENGTWKDGTKVDITILILSHNGLGTLEKNMIVSGMRANLGYGKGKWIIEPNTSNNGISGPVTYTYMFEKNAQPPTGDTSNNKLWIAIMLFSIISIGLVVKTRHIKNANK